MLWGKSTSNESKPKWLKGQYPKENVFATLKGWVYKWPSGFEELLVSVPGLATLLAESTIDALKWNTGAFERSGTQSVFVSYNEAVTVTGSPTLVVTGTGGTTSITATYAAVTGEKNKIKFTFTIPNEATTLSVGAQSIALNGGSIVDAVGGATSSVVITAGMGTALGTKVVA